MTKEEFITFYCEESRMALELLASISLVPVPCNCDDDCCLGWKMVVKGSQTDAT